MASARITVASEPTVYHLVTRVSRGEFLFGDVEKERMCRLLWQVAEFCGVEILTHAVMSNHVHIVVRVPVKEINDVETGNAEVLRRFGVLHGKDALKENKQLLASASEDVWAAFRDKHLPLMHNLSWFVRLLKQRFSRWYNSYHKARGTLWAERFASVIIEGSGTALLATCAYVDLNPVRAKLVKDPKDYHFSGYGEAVAGKLEARRGLEIVAGASRCDWRKAQAVYRKYLYADEPVAKTKTKGTSKAGRKAGQTSEMAAQANSKEGGELPWAATLTSKVRHFTRGAVLGAPEFVERIFEMKRGHFSPGRTTGARKIRGKNWAGLSAIRNLRPELAAPVPLQLTKTPDLKSD